MPVLRAEPALFPPDLLESPEELAAGGRAWRVLHTRPRQEKCVARALFDAEVPFYLPLVSRRLRLRGRTMTSHVPVFDGYMFLLADAREHAVALATRRIVRTLDVGDAARLQGDLAQLAQLLASGGAITPEDRLCQGMRVIVRSGLLSGLEGVIVRQASGRRFVVQVDFLQKGASVLLDDYALVENV